MPLHAMVHHHSVPLWSSVWVCVLTGQQVMLMHHPILDKKERSTKELHWPGLEPGSTAWQATILPLDHQCFVAYTVNIPLSDNGFWILLQFAVRGGAMFHIEISEKTDVNK